MVKGMYADCKSKCNGYYLTCFTYSEYNKVYEFLMQRRSSWFQYILTSNNFIGCLCRQFWFSFFITLSWNFHTECRLKPCVCQDSFLVVFLGTQAENPYEFLTLVAKVIWRKNNCLTRISLTRNNIFAVLCRFMVTMFITWFRLWERSNEHQQLEHEYLHFGFFSGLNSTFPLFLFWNRKFKKY